MKRTRFWMFIILFFACLLIGSSLSARAADQTGEEHHTVRIPASAIAAFDQLSLDPVVQLNYDTFYWVELSASDFARLATSDTPYTEVAGAGQVQILSYRFDPLVDGEPAIVANMMADAQAPGFHLVQFIGPIRAEWLAALEATGLPMLQYYPHNAYLTWGTAEQLQATDAFSFVRWQGPVHPAYKVDPNLSGFNGRIENVDIVFANDGGIEATLDTIRAQGATVLQHFPSQPDKALYDAIVQVDAGALNDLAHINTVLWLGYLGAEPILDDEMSSQIVAGNHPGGVPELGYFAHLAAMGVDGSGVTWAIVDTGVDYDHPDLNTHIVGGYSFPGACNTNPGDDCAGGGHGTHVAGIVGGDATGGFTDADGFLYGLGMAPEYGIFAMNSLSGPFWPPTGGWQEHSKQAVLGGAIGGNNSWTTGEGTQHGYQASERTHDFMVRDGNFDTPAVAEPFIEVFSAGNSGSAGLTAPKEAKNLIVTASSRNYRAGNIDTISSFSSRGPAVDGRWVPTIAAPGEQIASTRNDLGGSCGTAIPGTNGLYSFCSGTSMAAPHTAGTIVLITDWWRDLSGGADPSPALAKALVVNGAVDMAAADIPNIDEGWGRINITNIVSASVPFEITDQETVFDNTGEQLVVTWSVADPTKPVKISLAWSDAPGAIGANPALVNNLDLTVSNGGNTYLGNVFSGGWSVTGGTADTINNLENVYIQNPVAGSVSITIDATSIVGDGIPIFGDTTDQDFALVCQNCLSQPDFTLIATPESQTICGGTDAIYTLDIGQVLGFNDPVALSVSGNPAGTTAVFSTNPVTPPGSSDLTIGNTAVAPFGSYTMDVVGVATTRTHTVTVGLDVFPDVPAAPTLTSPADGAVDVEITPTFTWDALPDAVGYTFELAEDSAFTTIIDSATLTGTTYTTGLVLDSLTTYYWRVSGQNICGDGATTSASFTVRYVPDILLVDDDDNNPDMRGTYTAVLDALGVNYDIYDTIDNGHQDPSQMKLSSYTTILWFTGDNFSGRTGPNDAGEAALAAHLDATPGSCLFLTSQDYMFARGGPGQANLTPFMEDYLGAASGISDVTQVSVTGAGEFAGLGPYNLNYPFNNFSDEINPDGTAATAFTGNAGSGNAAISKTTAGWRTTWWGFPFEAIPSAAERETTMTAVLGWCGVLETYGVQLSGINSQTDAPGATVTYTVSLTNTGNVTDTFVLSATGQIWPTSLSTNSLEVNPGQAATFTVMVTIPAEPAASMDEVTITAVSTADGSGGTEASITLTTHVITETTIFLPVMLKP